MLPARSLQSCLEPVAPPDCALAIGLPLDAAEFERDLERPADFDFAANVRRLNGVTATGAWRLYAGTAAYAARVCDLAAGDGATVVRAASLDDLARLFAGHTVVSVVSHTTWPAVTAADLRDPELAGEIIRRGGQPAARALRRALHGETGRNHWSADEIVAVLRRVAERAHAQAARDGHSTVDWHADTDGFPARHLGRPKIEAVLGTAIAPARVFELRDGLHTLAELVAAIPADFDGVVDLTICSSAMLAPAIKRARPRCLVVVNRGLTSIDVRLARYRVILKGLRRHPTPFLKMLGEVHSLLSERKESR